MKVQKGMGSTWLSMDGWSTLAFWMQILAWLCGAVATAAGVTAYWARSNSTFLKDQSAKAAAEVDRIARGPRTLPAQQADEIGVEVKKAGLSIVVIALTEPEARNYAEQFLAAFSIAQVPVKVMSVGMIAVYGVEVWGDEPAATKLTEILAASGLQVRNRGMFLPVPRSAAREYLGYAGLVVGFKPSL